MNTSKTPTERFYTIIPAGGIGSRLWPLSRELYPKQLLPLASSMVAMREELRALWLNTHRSREQLTQDLQAWCQRAEASGIEALRDFSRRLRQVRA